MNELRNIQDFKRDLVPSYISHHGPHTLLTGCDNGLCASTHDLFYLAPGDFSGKLGVDHLEVAATTATLAIFAVFGEFHKFDAGDGSDHFPWFVKYPGASTQITRIMISNRQ